MRSTTIDRSEVQPDAQMAGLSAGPAHLLSHLLDDLQMVVWEAAAVPDHCLFVSQSLTTLLGYADEGCRQPDFWRTQLDPDTCAQLQALSAAALLTGSAQSLDLAVRAADGRSRWFHTMLHVLTGDPETPARILALLTDITLQKQAEAALRESEARFHETARNSTDMISRHAPDGTFRYVSPASEPLLGYLPDELVGLSPYSLIHPDDVEALRTIHAEMIEQPMLQSLTYRIQRRDGQYIWFETMSRPQADPENGAIIEIHATSRDITERKRDEEERTLLFAREQLALAEAEVLRKTDRLKSEFLASVSHELRTPLHHIKGYATTLLRPGLHFDEQTTREYLRIIAEESDKLERLIADLLDTSRIETDTLALDIDSIQLNELVQQVVRHWQSTNAHHFEAIMPATVPPIPGDAYRIQQVLDNLLANVVRHTPANTLATVTLEVTREDVIVAVRDYGPGIAAEHLPHLFERFYQAEPHNLRRLGNGLGLFICKGIIEQHGGWMSVETPATGGALFRFSLPRRRVGARTKALRPSSTAAANL